jgi:hypothetical protein
MITSWLNRDERVLQRLVDSVMVFKPLLPWSLMKLRQVLRGAPRSTIVTQLRGAILEGLGDIVSGFFFWNAASRSGLSPAHRLHLAATTLLARGGTR